MNRIKITLVITCLAGLACYGFFWPKHESVVYIDNTKIFHDFDMTKSLEKELVHDQQKRKYTLDSLKLEFQSWNKGVDSVIRTGKPSGELVLKTRQFENYIKNRETELQQQDINQAKDLDAKIWGQINQYVEEYGKENDYDIVLGVSGGGNVMYGKKEKDKTDDVIKYINKKYRGQK